MSNLAFQPPLTVTLKHTLRTIDFKTPAKINTFLFIQRKRDDGFHELEMDLIPVGFYDTIQLTETTKQAVTLECNLDNVAVEENLVVKAVRLLESKTGNQFSLDIKLQKAIPSGAGLGGGSGNAAGMLSVLNIWYKLGLTDSELRQLALRLGADVPFFINPKPSQARGIGEALTMIPDFEPLSILLIYPGFSIATRLAYRHCRISARKPEIHDYSVGAFERLSWDRNDFWDWLVLEYPLLAVCRQTLVDQGAIYCGLSGSGSTLFGIFRDEADGIQAAHRITTAGQWKPVICQTLSGHTYLP